MRPAVAAVSTCALAGCHNLLDPCRVAPGVRQRYCEPAHRFAAYGRPPGQQRRCRRPRIRAERVAPFVGRSTEWLTDHAERTLAGTDLEHMAGEVVVDTSPPAQGHRRRRPRRASSG